jgi:hypothetical protein
VRTKEFFKHFIDYKALSLFAFYDGMKYGFLFRKTLKRSCFDSCVTGDLGAQAVFLLETVHIGTRKSADVH